VNPVAGQGQGVIEGDSATLDLTGGGSDQSVNTNGAAMGTVNLSGSYTGSILGGSTGFVQLSDFTGGTGGVVLDFTGALEWVGTFNGNILGGTVINAGTMTINTTSSDLSLEGMLTNAAGAGIINVTGTNAIGANAGGALIDNQLGATFTFMAGASLNNGLAPGTFTNTGTLKGAAGANNTATIQFPVNGPGIIEGVSGTLHLTGGGNTEGGTVTVDAADGNVILSGKYSGDFTGKSSGSGHVQLSNFSGGSKSGSAASLNFGPNVLEWTGGSLGGILVNSGMLTINATNNLSLEGTLTNAGENAIINVTGTNNISANTPGAAIDNAGTFNFTSAASLTNGFYTGTLTNSGLLEMSADSGTATIAFPVNGSGTIEGETAGGTLDLTGGGSGGSGVVVPANITTVAGTGTAGNMGDGAGPARAADLNFPGGVAVDASGQHLFIADSNNNVVEEVDLEMGTITTVAGGGSNASLTQAGLLANQAELADPSDVAVDSSGDLFIADTGNNVIREVIPVNGFYTNATITTVAGNGPNIPLATPMPANQAELAGPASVAVDNLGDLFIADTGNNLVEEVNIAMGTIMTVAGTGTAAYGGVNGPATQAELNEPAGVAVDQSGDLYIADGDNAVVREVMPGPDGQLADGNITTIAGINGGFGEAGNNGQATAATLNFPAGLALDSSGHYLFIADGEGNVVREVDLTTGVITAFAGGGSPSSGIGDNGPPTAAVLNAPTGISVDAPGNVYIADTFEQVIREVMPASGPATATVTAATGATVILSGGYSGYFGDSGTSGTGLVELSDFTGTTAQGGATLDFTHSNLQWNAGSLSGTVTNAGAMTINTTNSNLSLEGTLINAAGTGIINVIGTNNISADFAGASIVNDGTFDFTADATLSDGFDTGAFTNDGTLVMSAPTGTSEISYPLSGSGSVQIKSGTLAIDSGTLAFDNSEYLSIAANASLTLGGSLAGNTMDISLFTPGGNVLLDGSGTQAAPQTVELMSQDLGNVAAGFENNFDFGTLTLGNGTYVKLVDDAQNIPGDTNPDAMYLNYLTVPAGCTLDLNGLHVYVRCMQGTGRIIGSPMVLGAGGPLKLNTPASGMISQAGQVDNYTFTSAQIGQTVTVVVSTGGQSSLPPSAPTVNYVQVQLLDPSGNVLMTQTNPQTGGDCTLSGIQLSVSGTYQIKVQVPASEAGSKGNYYVTVWNADIVTNPLNTGATVTNSLNTIYSKDQYTFSGVAGA